MSFTNELFKYISKTSTAQINEDADYTANPVYEFYMEMLALCQFAAVVDGNASCQIALDGSFNREYWRNATGADYTVSIGGEDITLTNGTVYAMHENDRKFIQQKMLDAGAGQLTETNLATYILAGDETVTFTS